MTSRSKPKLKAEVSTELAPIENQETLPPALAMLRVIDKAATDPRTNVEKMRALLDMQMELVREQRRVEYNNAMRATQEEMQPVVRKAMNDNTKKKYAKLEHVDNAVRPIYTKNGFSLSFNSRREEDGTITMLCDVLHSSGHSERKELNGAKDMTGAKGTANKTDIQGAGSTVSYLRRYLTCMVFNITLIDEDDDGQGGKLEKGVDPFADKLKKPEPEISFHDQLRQEAAKLETALKERNVEKRGGLFMKNTPLINQLNEAGLNDVAEHLRSIAEGTNEQS